MNKDKTPTFKTSFTHLWNYVHIETPLSPWEYIQQPQPSGTIYTKLSVCVCVCVCVCECVYEGVCV